MEDLDSTLQGLKELEQFVDAYFAVGKRTPDLYGFVTYFPLHLLQELKKKGVDNILDSIRATIIRHLHCHSKHVLAMSSAIWDSSFFAEEFPEVLPSMLQQRPIEVSRRTFLKNYNRYLTMDHDYPDYHQHLLHSPELHHFLQDLE